jgi:glycogen debranching enzyme
LGSIQELKDAALQVLLHNLNGPYQGLPRTAGWGYPEPYTRDWMIAALGILVTENAELMAGLRRLLTTLANHQTRLGHIPSLAHDPSDRGASDTTPLFLIAVALYRSVSGEVGFLDDAVEKSLTWLDYQSPEDGGLVAQQPTSDWRDEQWIYGYGLYVNTLVYACSRLYGLDARARSLQP